MRWLLDIVYPRHCLVCSAPAAHSLCDDCSHQLVLFDNTHRCPTCFREKLVPHPESSDKLSAADLPDASLRCFGDEHIASIARLASGGRAFSTSQNFLDGVLGLCRHCHKDPMPFDRLAAALPLAPTAPLLSALRRRQLHLARPLASFLVAQLIALDWPTPDIIIPVPRRLPYGFHHTHLLAKETALLLHRPLATPLRRRIGDYPQSALTPKERLALSRDRFRLRRNTLDDKILLLIDDSMTTRTTMRRCGEHLRDAFPKQLYGLTIAMPDTDTATSDASTSF